MLTRRGVEVVEFSRHELTVTPVTSGPAVPKPHAVYDGNVVPQFWWRVDKGMPVQDARSAPSSALICFRGSLRGDQCTASDAILKSLRDTGGGVAALPTGFGKTVLGLHTASVLQTRTLVIVHKSFLARQWQARAAEFVPGARVTTFGLGQRDATGDIVVATIQTLLLLSVEARGAFDGFGLVIVDECHRIAAPSFCTCMFRVGLCAKFVLGLSATPTRADGLERVIHWLCGPLIPLTLRADADSVDVTVVRPMFPVARSVPLNRLGDVDHAALITALADDGERTRFIVEKIPDDGRDVLVLSHRRAHCTALAEMLRHRGSDAATYLGGDTTVPSSRVICSTYALVSEGFDEPRLSVLVLATPASNVVQAVGRILRDSSSSRRLIIDILDACSVCHAQASKRKALYLARGWLKKTERATYRFRDD